MDRICEDGLTLTRGRFLLFNNLWGASTGEGQQCLWSDAEAGAESGEERAQLPWGTSWSWTGDPDTVKSYAAAVLGWHWGWPLGGGPLPVPLAQTVSVRADWAFDLTVETPSRLNVSYDIWLARVADPTMAELTDEVMIWLHREGGPTPIGERHGYVEVDGALWELWEGPHPSRGWQVHSFVRAENAASTSLELVRFCESLAGKMPRAAYLVGIQAGTEIFTGAGRLETRRYSVDLVVADAPGD